MAGRRVTLTASPGATLDPPRVVTDSHGRAQAALSVDAARRWVYRIEAVDEKGCSGKSAPLSVVLDRPRSNSIRLLPNGYFAGAEGRAFVPLGGNVATRRWVMRDVIWMALTGGSPGVFFWNARGSEVREFRMAREALRLLDLTTWRRAKPEIGIDVRHPLDDDKWFRTDQGKQAQAMMGRYAQHYLSEGVDFDFTTTPTDYQQSCSARRFAPPIPNRRVFQVSEGWQLSYLARDDWREVLVYVRNFAGAEEWACDMDRHRWRQYLRRRAPMRLRIECLLPAGRYRITIHDLDEETAETRDMRSNEALDLGVTDHDFGLVLRAADDQR